jgi:hypothetical protein
VYDKLCDNNIGLNNHLTFAWDHKFENEFYTQLKNSVKKTEILVVIGYSFPFFNRDVDKLIINDFMGETLRKVYFQSVEEDVKDIRERFLAIKNNIGMENLLLRTDTKQFTLPNEL